MIHSYMDLEVWQKAMSLTEGIYSVTKCFPREETYGLVSQMRRAAISVPSNIAEGHTRRHTGEYIQFIYISLGSIAELRTQMLLSIRLKYIGEKEAAPTITNLDEVGRMLRGVLKGLNSK